MRTKDADSDIFFDEPEEDIFFGLIDEDALNKMRRAWKLYWNFDWFICCDPLGCLLVGKPSIWIMSRDEYVKFLRMYGWYFFDDIFPAKSIQIAGIMEGIMVRNQKSLRKLDIQTAETLLEISDMETDSKSRNLFVLLQ